MPSVEYAAERTLPMPPKDLFDWVGTPEGLVRWTPEITEVRRSAEGVITRGEQWVEKRGRRRSLLRVASYEPPRSISLSGGPPGLTMTWHYNLAVAEGGLATRLKVHLEIRMNFLWGFLLKRLARHFESAPELTLVRLEESLPAPT